VPILTHAEQHEIEGRKAIAGGLPGNSTEFGRRASRRLVRRQLAAQTVNAFAGDPQWLQQKPARQPVIAGFVVGPDTPFVGPEEVDGPKPPGGGRGLGQSLEQCTGNPTSGERQRPDVACADPAEQAPGDRPCQALV